MAYIIVESYNGLSYPAPTILYLVIKILLFLTHVACVCTGYFLSGVFGSNQTPRMMVNRPARGSGSGSGSS